MRRTAAVILAIMLASASVLSFDEKLWFSAGAGIRPVSGSITKPLTIEMNLLAVPACIITIECGYDIRGRIKLTEGTYLFPDRYLIGAGLKYSSGQPGEKYGFCWNAGVKAGAICGNGIVTTGYTDINTEADFWMNRFFGFGLQAGWLFADSWYNMYDSACFSGPYIKAMFLFDWWQNFTKTVRGGWEF